MEGAEKQGQGACLPFAFSALNIAPEMAGMIRNTQNEEVHYSADRKPAPNWVSYVKLIAPG